MTFENLKIPEQIMESIKGLRFEAPTDIQRKTIPLILEGKDVIAGSATGSGKTLAFGVGLINSSEKGKGLQALVLTPTRELAEQVMQSLRVLSKHKRLNVTAVYGGVSINPQINDIKNSEIVVGTPGRLLDHLQRGTLDLSRIKSLVLDEADRMLDMGFFDDVTEIVKTCKGRKQTMLFSATIPSEVEHLANKFMNNPVRIRSDNYVDPKKLHQVYYNVSPKMKFSMLYYLLKQEEESLVMVFCNSRKYTDIIAKSLNKNGIEAMAIHGGLTQARRQQVIKKFNSSNPYVLVCTDVAARGLDIPGVSHVYNYDIPNDSNQYVHRIGRTARAGKSGKAVSLISHMDHENFSRVERDLSVEIKKLDTPPSVPNLQVASSGGGNRRPIRQEQRPPRQGNSWRGRSRR